MSEKCQNGLKWLDGGSQPICHSERNPERAPQHYPISQSKGAAPRLPHDMMSATTPYYYAHFFRVCSSTASLVLQYMLPYRCCGPPPVPVATVRVLCGGYWALNPVDAIGWWQTPALTAHVSHHNTPTKMSKNIRSIFMTQ